MKCPNKGVLRGSSLFWITVQVIVHHGGGAGAAHVGSAVRKQSEERSCLAHFLLTQSRTFGNGAAHSGQIFPLQLT